MTLEEFVWNSDDLARISHHGKEIGKRVDGKRFLEASRTGRGFFRT